MSTRNGTEAPRGRGPMTRWTSRAWKRKRIRPSARSRTLARRPVPLSHCPGRSTESIRRLAGAGGWTVPRCGSTRSGHVLRPAPRLAPAARLQSLDFFAQVAGEVSAVRRLEVTKGSHGCREMIPLPLQVVERFSAAIFNLTIELLSATVCNGIETLCIDPGFRLDPRGTCTGVGGELTCGSAGLLSDPVGIRCNFLDQAFGLLRGHLDQADDGRAGFLSSCHHDWAGCRRSHRIRLLRHRWLNRRGLRQRGRSPSRNWRR